MLAIKFIQEVFIITSHKITYLKHNTRLFNSKLGIIFSYPDGDPDLSNNIIGSNRGVPPGAVLSVTMDFWRVRSNVYRVG